MDHEWKVSDAPEMGGRRTASPVGQLRCRRCLIWETEMSRASRCGGARGAGPMWDEWRASPHPLALDGITSGTIINADLMTPTASGTLDSAVRLLEYALHLRQHGERAPSGTETWAEFDRRAEAFLRAVPRTDLPADRPDVQPGPYRGAGVPVTDVRTAVWGMVDVCRDAPRMVLHVAPMVIDALKDIFVTQKMDHLPRADRLFGTPIRVDDTLSGAQWSLRDGPVLKMSKEIAYGSLIEVPDGMVAVAYTRGVGFLCVSDELAREWLGGGSGGN